MNNIKQVRYNKVNCTSCGESFRADLAAFDFDQVFADAVWYADVVRELQEYGRKPKAAFRTIEEAEEEKLQINWSPLTWLNLKFYYTIRDLCQEFDYKMDLSKPTELKLSVKDVKRQLEFLTGVSFSEIQKANRHDVLYNSLYEAARPPHGSPEETMYNLEQLIHSLTVCPDDRVIVAVPVLFTLSTDLNGYEMPSTMKYYLEDWEEKILTARVCPHCGASIDWLAGYRNEIVIGLAGLPRVGKTVFIASLIHQLKKLGESGFISIKKNDSESLSRFMQEIVSEYEKGNAVLKTEVENTEAIPLVYLPLQIGNREYNFIFVDMPGEIYGRDVNGLDFISNKRAILRNADVVWCFIEPSMIEKKYSNANIKVKTESADRQLSDLVRVLEIIYEERIPAAIIVTQSDLIDKYDPQYGLYRPEINVMEDYLYGTDSLNLTKTNEFVEATKAFVDQMSNFRLTMENVVEGFSMFAVASYGFDVSGKTVLSDNKIRPSMIELPFLWTLARLGLINSKILTTTSAFFGLGGEKEKAEEVKDLRDLYIRE